MFPGASAWPQTLGVATRTLLPPAGSCSLSGPPRLGPLPWPPSGAPRGDLTVSGGAQAGAWQGSPGARTGTNPISVSRFFVWDMDESSQWWLQSWEQKHLRALSTRPQLRQPGIQVRPLPILWRERLRPKPAGQSLEPGATKAQVGVLGEGRAVITPDPELSADK